MENKISKNKPKLFPRYFKIIGIFVLLMAIVVIIVDKTMSPQIILANRTLYKISVLNVIILGLFFIAWSKNKIEDEMIYAIRIRSMATSLLAGVVFLFIDPLIDLLFSNPLQSMDGQKVVMFMLLSYLFSFTLQKETR
jgi:ABC-type Fe3+-siderophore transport system permease subunit